MAKRLTKKQIYAKYGIEFKDDKILSPIGFINPLLKKGNSKVGENVFTFSLLPGTGNYSVSVNDIEITVKGTCVCDCIGCYAKTGFFVTPLVLRSMAINTYLCNYHIDFVERAIKAQLETLTACDEVRIHASGDFNTINPDAYAHMWENVVVAFPSKSFWTYTKMASYESLFDDVNNANIVRSIIPHIGINFGTCSYILNAYYTLKQMNIPVYICKCGVDENQHCEKCGVCSRFKFVLFLEHSTDYKPEDDPLFPEFLRVVNAQ